MPKTPDDYAVAALIALERYGPDTYKTLEKRSRDTSGLDRKTKANMRSWMITNGFATDAYVGHLSGKPGDATHKATKRFVGAVSAKLR